MDLQMNVKKSKDVVLQKEVTRTNLRAVVDNIGLKQVYEFEFL